MTDELLQLAHSVVDRALPGEGMEVYVTRGTETEVRAYEGEVESLTSADSSGVGIRLLLEGPDGATGTSPNRGSSSGRLPAAWPALTAGRVRPQRWPRPGWTRHASASRGSTPCWA